LCGYRVSSGVVLATGGCVEKRIAQKNSIAISSDQSVWLLSMGLPSLSRSRTRSLLKNEAFVETERSGGNGTN